MTRPGPGKWRINLNLRLFSLVGSPVSIYISGILNSLCPSKILRYNWVKGVASGLRINYGDLGRSVFIHNIRLRIGLFHPRKVLQIGLHPLSKLDPGSYNSVSRHMIPIQKSRLLWFVSKLVQEFLDCDTIPYIFLRRWISQTRLASYVCFKFLQCEWNICLRWIWSNSIFNCLTSCT